MTSTRDPVGLALASLLAGASTGASVITGGMIFLRSAQLRTQDVDFGFTMMSAVLCLGLGTAVWLGYLLTRALDETWRRGAVGALALFGGALLAGIAAPADMLAGRVGMAAYLVILAAVALAALRAARRSAAA